MLCVRLVSFVLMREALREARGLIVKLFISLCCRLAFVRIFYLKSCTFMCIGPY